MLASRLVRLAAIVATAIGLVTTTWAVTQLRHGVVELPQHWWSTAAALPLLAGVAVLALGPRGPLGARRRQA